ncbi:hypothetical protein [Desulfovibrio legallii]|jgi:hypothetical protein|uniref:Uncharacterized protein n=1 Tax=Desulfovibrio legallii TaxID=571438 RepID=A0A6H3FAC2_9BACT|nr:hypothetical protein [Desulfovibrio legallii]TBH79530.1 hypothetical protein EB812_08030 [Desulfovibrio legallii]DAZ80395.1 MAG TPA: hypothetical protein [Caudoviricetes sp.]
MSDRTYWRARLFDALHGEAPRPDAKTRENAVRRIVFSEDGLTLMGTLSDCLRPQYGPFSAKDMAWREGRRSVLLELLRMALKEERRPERRGEDIYGTIPGNFE